MRKSFSRLFSLKPPFQIIPDLSFAVPVTALLLTAVLSSAGAVETVWLSELDLTHVRQGFGQVQADKSVQGLPLTIQGRKFERGVGTHAPGGMTIELPEGAGSFSACQKPSRSGHGMGRADGWRAVV